MDRFPQVLYRYPAQGVGVHQIQDEEMRLQPHDTMVVHSELEIADGWYENPAEARKAHRKSMGDNSAKLQEAAAEDERQQAADLEERINAEVERRLVEAGMKAADTSDDGIPATREELEAKATQLGVKFDGRMKDETIAARIAEAAKA